MSFIDLLIKRLFKRLRTEEKSAPILIIKNAVKDSDDKEIKSLENSIAELEKNIHIPKESLEKLKSSFEILKNKTSIKINTKNK